MCGAKTSRLRVHDTFNTRSKPSATPCHANRSPMRSCASSATSRTCTWKDHIVVKSHDLSQCGKWSICTSCWCLRSTWACCGTLRGIWASKRSWGPAASALLICHGTYGVLWVYKGMEIESGTVGKWKEWWVNDILHFQKTLDNSLSRSLTPTQQVWPAYSTETESDTLW